MSDFNLDAILQEFNVGNPSEVPSTRIDDSVTRVRESLGLGRSLFRRKESPSERHELPPAKTIDDVDMDEASDFEDNDVVEKITKPRKRIVDSDDDDEDIPITRRPGHRSSSVLSSPHKDSDIDSSNSSDKTSNSSLSDSDEDRLPTTEDILADFRKAKLEALSAKVAAKSAPKNSTPPENDSDSHDIEMREIPMSRDVSLSPGDSGRKPKRRAAGKKAIEEMHRETQRMARNMGLKPEIKVAKKIEMSSIFAKFGFNPEKVKAEDNTPLEKTTTTSAVDENLEVMEVVTETTVVPATTVETAVPLPTRYTTPDLDASSDEESLPSPSKLATSYISKPVAAKQPTPRKVHFTLPATLSDDSDSDVEILPPRSNPSTTTPDRQRTHRSALIRSLANIKSPGQKSPGRLTHKELEAMLSREAAVQASKKREERRAELKSLGIDVGRIVEKRDALEEAREEARRVREEEGASESDEEYVDDAEEADVLESGDESEGSGDECGGSGDDEMDEIEDEDEEMADESGNEMDEEDMPKKKKGVARIISDDEDEDTSQAVIPESTIGSHKPSAQRLSDFQTEEVSLTQFFDNTQLSGSTEKPTQHSKSPQSESAGTGLTQFFTSTALEDEIPPSGEDAAHTRMDVLRHKAAQGVSDLGPESIGFQGVSATVNSTAPVASAISTASEAELDGSPVRRRILKRRNPEKSVVAEEPTEEINEAPKDFIEEQAEESEDDYAQWRSGDEDEENMDGVVDGLIDDETKINAKRAEQDLARFYMEDQLQMDEKVVKGLMHDIQNGGLRRRRGQLEMGDWDSDDDDEDADERRRRWELKREEMKRRMLEDENLGKLAANPKTQAFLNAISSTTLNYDDEPDFLGEEIIEDTKAGTASRNLPNSVPMGESQSQSQSQDTRMSVEIQVPATGSGNLSRHEKDRLVIDELTQIEDSQPLILDDISLSEASDSETEERESFVPDKVYTGFIDRAAQKRASRTISETQTRLAFKAVTSSSPARAKRTAVSVIEADDESTRKKIMKEVIGSKTVNRKAWGSTRGRGAVTFRGSGGRGKENVAAEMKKKGDGDADRRRRDMLMLMDSQNSFC